MEDPDYEWDEAKRVSNLVKHHLDFADVPVLLDGPAGAIRIISFRRAGDGERSKHQQAFCD